MSIPIVYQKWVNNHGICSGIHQAGYEIAKVKTLLIAWIQKPPLLLVNHNAF